MQAYDAGEKKLAVFLDELSSKAPVPGGGGASALIGAISAALCAMVANLTTGKKKYAIYQEDINGILTSAAASMERLMGLIGKDAEVFEPLSKAYGIPKDEPDRDVRLEEALGAACSVPMKILKEASELVAVIEQLSAKGSRLALSDVGVAAAACRAAMEAAAMNVFINTKLMKDRGNALGINAQAQALLADSVARCQAVYEQITKELGDRTCEG